MDIKGKSIMVLGGFGLVGSAICRELMRFNPEKLIITSLFEHEARQAVEQMSKEYPDKPASMFVPVWGNLFVRQDWKDLSRGELLSDDEKRLGLVTDVIDELDTPLLQQSALYQTVSEHKPDAVIDCINTATAIAYQDIYTGAREVLKELRQNNLQRRTVETLLASNYIPQLIRHVQILYKSLVEVGTTSYLKIGTSGTGGMGLNIPYTHSEERPSRVLLSKSSVAGAHTLLLFLMARTPDAPLTKEIKPTATIAWKRIAFGEVLRRGQPIPLVDMSFDDALEAAGTFVLDKFSGVEQLGANLEAAFIDTGENGIFSRGEFEAISAAGQMELVRPEDIAEAAVQELRGGNSGHDVLHALDSSVLEPSYRAGVLRESAIRTLAKLEQEHGVDSIAFEMLGPPRLSKLLFEAFLLKHICETPQGVIDAKPEDVSAAAEALLKTRTRLRAEMLSIGVAILLSDGKQYLRGEEVKIPPYRGERELPMTQENIDLWCEEGWIDLRPSNIVSWQKRFQRILDETNAIPIDDTSSRHIFTREYWDFFETITPGKVIAWVFAIEEKGWRMKD